MADPNDVSATKMARREFSKRHIDLTLADVRVMHGVCYLRGTVSAQKSGNIPDVRLECEHIARLLRTKPEIRDVVLDCTYRT
jgi:hypothetical protein